MDTQWRNFLCNLGEWRGTFCTLDHSGDVLDTSPSILTLEQGDEERLVHFRLRRYANADLSGEPTRDMREDYRSLGRQVVFFSCGSFCKGSLQVAPGTPFGGEFGFISQDRRHRLVQLHNADGTFDKLVLIREFRAGSDARERPRLAPEQLQGHWRGEAETITADWPEPERASTDLEVDWSDGALLLRSTVDQQSSELRASGDSTVLSLSGDPPARLTLLPDGGGHISPERVSHRQGFAVEAFWLEGDGQLQRLIRRYDASGAWRSATWMGLRRG